MVAAPDDHAAWLGEDAARDLAELLRPCPSEELRARLVGAAVNSEKNDGPECVEAAT